MVFEIPADKQVRIISVHLNLRGENVKHKESGELYYVIGLYRDHTNDTNKRLMFHYMDFDGRNFLMERERFAKEFEPVLENKKVKKSRKKAGE